MLPPPPEDQMLSSPEATTAAATTDQVGQQMAVSPAFLPGGGGTGAFLRHLGRNLATTTGGIVLLKS